MAGVVAWDGEGLVDRHRLETVVDVLPDWQIGVCEEAILLFDF